MQMPSLNQASGFKLGSPSPKRIGGRKFIMFGKFPVPLPVRRSTRLSVELASSPGLEELGFISCSSDDEAFVRQIDSAYAIAALRPQAVILLELLPKQAASQGITGLVSAKTVILAASLALLGVCKADISAVWFNGG
jgi:hypothetical protein